MALSTDSERVPGNPVEIARRVAVGLGSGHGRTMSGSDRCVRRLAGRLLGAAVLALVCWGMYGRTLHYELIFDDLVSISRNESIKRLSPLFGSEHERGPLRPSPGTPLEVRPLVNLTFALNYRYGGDSPAGYRLVAIVGHFLVSLVTWAIVTATLRSAVFANRFADRAESLGLAAALVWMTHPVHEETVVYVTQRTELQMGLFYALTMLAAIRFWASSRMVARIAWLTAVTFTSVGGMLSKEMMASVPAVAALYELTFVERSGRALVRRSWPLYVVLCASWGPLVWLYSSGAGTPLAGFNNTISAHDFWLTQCKSFFVYWRMVFWPWPLLIHHDVPTLRTLAAAWPWVLAIGGYLAVAAGLSWRRHPAGFALASFFIVLSPTLVVPLPHEEIAERRLYVAALTILPLLTIAAMELTRAAWARAVRGRLAPWGGVTSVVEWLPTITVTAVCFAIVVATVPRLATRSGLWAHVLEHQPDNSLALTWAGWQQFEDGDRQAGLDKILKAYAATPRSSFIGSVLTAAFDRMGNYPRMLAVCRQQCARFPRRPATVQQLAVALEKNGRYPEAIAKYRQVLHLMPNAWDAHSALATLLAEHNRTEEAIRHFEIANEIRPDFMNLLNLFTLYGATGRGDQALDVVQRLTEAARRELPRAEAERIVRDVGRHASRLRSMGEAEDADF